MFHLCIATQNAIKPLLLSWYDPFDIVAVEKTGMFKGTYHVFRRANIAD